MNTWLQEQREFWFLRGLPTLAAALPHGVRWRFLNHLAQRWKTPDGTAAAAAYRRHQDEAIEPIGSDDTWEARYRLIRWTERTDMVLAGFRSPQAWAELVQTTGLEDLPSGPCLILGSHWGAGPWLWPFLNAHQRPTLCLAKRPVSGDFGTAGVAASYGAWRAKQILKQGCAGLIFTGGARQAIRDSWAKGCGVFANLDLPAYGQAGTVVDWLGQPAKLPHGLVELALEAQVPVVFVAVGADFDNGQRTFRVQPAPFGASVAQVMAAYATFVTQDIQRTPEAWALWPLLPAFYDLMPEKTPSTPTS